VICIGSCNSISFSTAASAPASLRTGRRIFLVTSSPSRKCDRLWLLQWPDVRKFLLQCSQVNGFAPGHVKYCHINLHAQERFTYHSSSYGTQQVHLSHRNCITFHTFKKYYIKQSKILPMSNNSKLLRIVQIKEHTNANAVRCHKRPK